MSILASFNGTKQDTPIEGVTAKVLTVPTLNYDVDFAVLSTATKGNQSEAVIANVGLPLGSDETIKFGVANIVDIYANKGYNPDYMYGSMGGKKILSHVTKKLIVTDSVDSTYRRELPFTAQLVITVPNSPLVTVEIVDELVGRLLGSMYDKAIPQYLRKVQGALIPKDL